MKDRKNYILIHNQKAKGSQNCCRLGMLKFNCACNRTLYKIKPYSLELLNVMSLFFEIIAFSKLPEYQANQIIDHFDALWLQTYKKPNMKA